MLKENLLGKEINELTNIVLKLDMPKFRGKQIADWIYHKNVTDINNFTNFSKKDRELLLSNYSIYVIKPSKFAESTDGTKKYLFNLDENNAIEVAYIPEGNRKTLCISCQVGCRMGCKFCMTEKQSMQRNLSSFEIINQIIAVPEFESITNIVLMGMGEPLDNYNEVVKVLDIITKPFGLNISPRKVTLSTVGVTPNLKKFLRDRECNLALSVHNPISKERLKFMPVENSYSIANVIEAIKEVDFSKNRKLSVEYILFKDLNDSILHVKSLVKLLHGTKAKVNLISYHSIPGEDFEGVTRSKTEWFRDELKKRGIQTTIRKSRGEDIDAACGLLSTKDLINREKNRNI